jgi:toxin ParE1/3/4
MAKFKLRKEAVNDLSAIWDYSVDTWSEKQADKYYKLLIDACAELVKKPKPGMDYSEIYPELKGQKIAKHIIFFRVMEDKSIEVARILHERMDRRIH